MRDRAPKVVTERGTAGCSPAAALFSGVVSRTQEAVRPVTHVAVAREISRSDASIAMKKVVESGAGGVTKTMCHLFHALTVPKQQSHCNDEPAPATGLANAWVADPMSYSAERSLATTHRGRAGARRYAARLRKAGLQQWKHGGGREGRGDLHCLRYHGHNSATVSQGSQAVRRVILISKDEVAYTSAEQRRDFAES